MLSLLYIARLRVSLPKSLLQEGAEYKILVVALMLAQKFHSDENIPNTYWGLRSGLEARDLSLMELEFLQGLDSRLFVKQVEFGLWKQSIASLFQEFSVYKKVNEIQQSSCSSEQSDKGSCAEAVASRKSSISKKSVKQSRSPLPRAKTWK